MKKLVLIALISISSNVYSMQDRLVAALKLTQQLCYEKNCSLLSDNAKRLDDLLKENGLRTEQTENGDTLVHIVLKGVTEQNAQSRAFLAYVILGRFWGFEKDSESDNSKPLFIPNNDGITPLDEIHRLAESLPVFRKLILDIPSWTNRTTTVTCRNGIPTITFDDMPPISDSQFTFTEAHATKDAIPLFPTGLPLALLAAADQKLQAAQKALLAKITKLA